MSADDKLTHFNRRGEAHMVDVGDKPLSARKAVAEGWINMRADTMAMIRARTHAKGDVLAIARVAGIMAAKRTADLVPLCHPIMLTRVSIQFDINDSDNGSDNDNHGIHCTATTATHERTGVEMEALSAVQIALLTIYDMCKATDRGMTINGVRLTHKSGGKSAEWNRVSGA